jgi:hypothetical protein
MMMESDSPIELKSPMTNDMEDSDNGAGHVTWQMIQTLSEKVLSAQSMSGEEPSQKDLLLTALLSYCERLQHAIVDLYL